MPYFFSGAMGGGVMTGPINRVFGWLAIVTAGGVLAFIGCAAGPPESEVALRSPLSPEAESEIDSAIQSLKEQLARVRTNDFPEQIVFLLGSPSRIRHKLEQDSPFYIHRSAAKVVLFTSYIYDVYDVAVRWNAQLAAYSRDAVYSRAAQAGVSPLVYFVFIDGRLFTISDHEFF